MTAFYHLFQLMIILFAVVRRLPEHVGWRERPGQHIQVHRLRGSRHQLAAVRQCLHREVHGHAHGEPRWV